MAGHRPLRRGFTQPVQQDELVNFAERLDQNPIINGQLVETVFPANGATATAVRHSLGRSYRGAIIIATSVPLGGSAPLFTVAHPSTVIDAGFDPSLEVLIISDTVPTEEHLLTLWVM